MANEALRLIGTSADAGADPATDELNLREVWRALMRRKLALLTPVVLIPLAVFLWAKQQPPLYQAEALLHVRDREAQVVQVEGVVEELVADEATIESEIEYLNSPAFSRRVVEKLGFREEGLRPRYLHIDGDWRDHIAYALNAEEVPEGLLTRWRAYRESRGFAW